MHRQYLIQQLINKHHFKTYLEIGVFKAKVFFDIKAKNKIAVDPDFKFSTWAKFKAHFLNKTNRAAQFFEHTSDHFFENKANHIFDNQPIEIALIDGMHEYQFALRDVLNTINYLSPNGIIIMHDCNPDTAQSASSFKEWEANQFLYNWHGDVWKVITYIRSQRPDLTAYVCDTDFGLGIITKQPNNNTLALSEADINNLTYNDFEAKKDSLIGLTSVKETISKLGL
jgi:hypothetical protein